MPFQSTKSLPASKHPLAPVFTHAHSALLLATYCAVFPSFVADPPTALLSTLPLVTLLQVGHAILCLDPIRSPDAKPPPAAAPRRLGVVKPTKETPGLSSKVLQSTLSLLLSSTAGVVVLYLCLVMFGAPVTTHFSHTSLCAVHMSLLVTFPLVYKYGVDGDRWRDIISIQIGLDEAFGGALGACVGAWLGAIPIPLDWDREWQKWPVTILSGVYAGYVLGKSVGTFFQGKRLPF